MVEAVFVLLELFVRSPSHLDCDKLEGAAGLDALPGQQESKVVRDAVAILASDEVDEFRRLISKAKGIYLLNLISLLNF